MKKLPLLGSLPLYCLAVLVAGCGTTSKLKPAIGQRIDLTQYDRLLVETFKDEFSAKAKPVDRPQKQAEADMACKMFAERIAAVVKETGAFREVVREGVPDAQTLILTGAITRYVEGDATLRFLIGLGAGSSYFDARVELVDGTNNAVLGSWLVDRNSWGLGGGLAATQTPEGFMKSAAEKIGEDLAAARKAGFYEPKTAEQPVTRR